MSTLARGERVEVSPDIVDELNARHAGATQTPTPEEAVAHLLRSGDRFVALVESLPPEQVAGGGGGVTIARFTEIAALHADSHRAELETALAPDHPPRRRGSCVSDARALRHRGRRALGPPVAIGPDQWSAPTPCPDWTVRDLVVHVIGTRAVLTRLDESTPAPRRRRMGDLVAQW